MRVISILLFAVCLPSFGVTILDHKHTTFSNVGCPTGKNCSLLKAEAYSVRKKVMVHGDENYLTEMIASYETDGLDTLEDYAFVNFIKGCNYLSRQEKNGDITVEHPFVKSNLGRENTPFNFADWTVDSWDVDPMYASIKNKNFPRHASYRWVKDFSLKPLLNRKNDFIFGKSDAPIKPSLFVRDQPNGAFVRSKIKTAKSSTLKFKMCLYPAANIDPTGEQLPIVKNAIHCFDWQQMYAYDWKTNKMTFPKEISPVCATFKTK